MPTYSYACTECGNRFDAVQAFTDDALTHLPAVLGPVAQAVQLRRDRVQGQWVLPDRQPRAGESRKRWRSQERVRLTARRSRSRRRVRVRRQVPPTSRLPSLLRSQGRRRRVRRSPQPPRPADGYPQPGHPANGRRAVARLALRNAGIAQPHPAEPAGAGGSPGLGAHSTGPSHHCGRTRRAGRRHSRCGPTPTAAWQK